MTITNRFAAISALALILPLAVGSAVAEGDWDDDKDYDVQDLPAQSEDDGNGDWTTGDWNDDGESSTGNWDDDGGEPEDGSQSYGDTGPSAGQGLRE